MKNELVLLAGTRETCKELTEQLKGILGQYIRIKSFASEEYLPPLIEDALIVYSSYLIHDEVKHVIAPSCEVITAHRTVNYQYIDYLFEIPNDTNVLFVNDFPQSTIDSIETLDRLGIRHLRYIPYSPGREVPDSIEVAVTPGEMELIPSSIPTKLNLGVRLIDIHTIMAIIDYFELPEALRINITDKYTGKIIELSKKLSSLKQEADKLNQYLKRVVDGVNDGILAFDSSGSISVFNKELERMIGISPEYALKKKIGQVFRNNELLDFLLNDEAGDQEAFTVRQTNLLVHRFPMKNDNTIVATFKNMDETLEMERRVKLELQKKGFVSKYTFQSILGESQTLQETIRIAKKLSLSDLPILIQGESGTGKELFTGAIHSESSRKNAPFLGINCNALPEELLESELFGYEDGAFTGARKGGKKGLFEQADQGTLFLDEIGDISMKLQARLLRVLEEWEIRRIGGNKIIPINVRIIAATNRNLKHMIEEGRFREDLYHRLKVLSLSIPSLRQRRTDIPILIKSFIRQSQKPAADITEDTLELLSQMEWKGNIRELKNVVQYMLAVSDDNVLKVSDLPADLAPARVQLTPKTLTNLKAEHKILLTFIAELNEKGIPASRKKLSALTQNTNFPLTEQQARLRLKELEQLGFVIIRQGRSGTNVTEKGLEFALSNN
ncbi:PAS domain-containing protein [Cytobacillus firmus]|uniref:PAS domain-containing protein n=2 Tax=Cytobacillus TaxID=2675230 RepID=A0A366JNK6_CYTFI|nr:MULTISPECIES: sigma 54-interacting transcriptional regulator [Cytobacillus]RBP88758.1 PAS domain-containing protein [Cytobacillus firmus]TDX39543.1 PAS domain-containing protein [Cytobacillus oceanisediminis]